MNKHKTCETCIFNVDAQCACEGWPLQGLTRQELEYMRRASGSDAYHGVCGAALDHLAGKAAGDYRDYYGDRARQCRSWAEDLKEEGARADPEYIRYGPQGVFTLIMSLTAVPLSKVVQSEPVQAPTPLRKPRARGSRSTEPVQSGATVIQMADRPEWSRIGPRICWSGPNWSSNSAIWASVRLRSVSDGPRVRSSARRVTPRRPRPSRERQGLSRHAPHYPTKQIDLLNSLVSNQAV